MRRQIAMIIVSLIGIAVLCSPAQAAETATWRDWVELALRENPEYQLVLADYQLTLQEILIDDQFGIKEVELSVTPPTIDNYGLNNKYSMGIDFSGRLPYQVQMSGGTTLGKGVDGNLQVQSDLHVSLNLNDLRDLWNVADQQSSQTVYLDEWNRVKDVETGLIQKVIRNYYSFLRLPFQRDLAQAKWELAEIQFSQAKLDFEKGQITALAYYQAEDAYAAAQISHAERMQDQKQLLKEFASLFGREGTDPLFDSKGNWSPEPESLEMTQIDQIVAEWDEQSVDLYIQKNYSYQKAWRVLTSAEASLEKAKEAAQWNFNLNASMGYAVSGVGGQVDVNPFYMQGGITISKELFNPSTKINIEKAKVQVERQKIAVEESKSKLTQDITLAITKIEGAKETYQKALAEWKRWQDRIQRVRELYEAGYTSKEDWLTVQIAAYEQSVKLLQAEEEWIIARVQFGATLGLEHIQR